MKILVINGPNLNLLGKREPEIYGTTTLLDIETMCKKKYPDVIFDFFQSNHEGEIIEKIQQNAAVEGIIINAGAFTHTSIAILDALKFTQNATSHPKIIEVHISNIYQRESFRHHSFISGIADGVICGCGINGYLYATDFIINRQLRD